MSLKPGRRQEKQALEGREAVAFVLCATFVPRAIHSNLVPVSVQLTTYLFPISWFKTLVFQTRCFSHYLQGNEVLRRDRVSQRGPK